MKQRNYGYIRTIPGDNIGTAMPDSVTHDEIPPSVVGFPDCMLSEPSDSEPNGYSSEIWGLFLRTFANEQPHTSGHAQDPPITGNSFEINKPLQGLSGGTWQSLGGYFDYRQWTARDRFVELDNAIAATSNQQRFEFQKTA
jgi:hypothetical protein